MGTKGDATQEGERLMLYLLAILVPPLAVLLIGKPVQAVLNLVLTCLGGFLG